MRKPKSFLSLFFKQWTAWVALFFLVPTLIFGTIYYFSNRKAERLGADGVDGIALVIDKVVEQSRDDDGDIVERYYVKYQFEADGEIYEEDVKVLYSFFAEVQKGQEVPLRYWRADPSVFETAHGAAAETSQISKIVAMVLGGITLLFGLWARQRARRLIYLRDHGGRREFIVREVRATNIQINNRNMYRVVWDEGSGREGVSFLHRWGDLPEVGSEINVFVDLNGKLPSVWENDVTRA